MRNQYVKLPGGVVLQTDNPELWPEAERISRENGKRQLREEAVGQLKEIAPEGTDVYGIVLHVSRSGMMRRARFYVLKSDAIGCRPRNITCYMGNLLGWRHDGADWIQLDGCGMDMLFHAVNCTAHALYGNGNALHSRSL